VSTESPESRCCTHCDEIPHLRRQIAELRSLIDRLAAPATVSGASARPTTAKPPLPDEANLSVARPSCTRSDLPQADRNSPQEVKIELFRALFTGRDDVYAYRWENSREGKKGWAPKRRPGSSRDDNDYLPLTNAVVAEHLVDSEQTNGIYVMLPDSTCRLLVCDFDDTTWRLDACAYARAAQSAGVPTAIEVSRSGDGAHVWTFFSEPVAACDARAMGAALLREAMAIRGELGLESYDRFFPSQDYLPKKGLGNLIALPLQGRSRKHQGTTVFVDPATFRPYDDQFGYLSAITRMSREDVLERVEDLQPPTVGSAVRLHRSPLAGEPPPPPVIKAEFGGMLAIRRAGLPPGLLASLKHLAALHNPEFHEKQAMGFSVWDTPRMLRCYDETLEHLYLPRGISDRAAQLIEKAGSRLEVTDVRPDPDKLEVTFTGELRGTDQQSAVEAMASHDLGVLVAPPGAGKTVMACALIAHHQAPTLVLVDRGPLLTQWKQRLSQYLGLDGKQIGQLGGGKNHRTGRLDLATLQTLARMDDPGAVLAGYGLVIVDECHHVAANTFASAIKSIPARRWLGLTATPKRTDQREQVMFMHCGPVRHRLKTVGDLTQTLHIHPTSLTIRQDIDTDIPGLLQSVIVPALVTDTARTRQIADHVTEAISHSRHCLVLAGRTEHVDLLAAELTSRGLTPLILHGAIAPKQRRTILERLETWNPDRTQPPLLLVATASYIGEGFDCPALDTLFLCSPVSSEPLITQYVGRIMREHPGKTTVEVHDYADTKIATLTRMHGKRLTAYRRLGFSTAPITTLPPADPAATPTQILSAPAKPSPAQVRSWAKSQGLEIADRGRIRPDIWDQYHGAHSG
jgi:superfamily II DNA or RNA helicase